MQTIKIETHAGEHFIHAAQRAKELSSNGIAVEFDFNGIRCVVDQDTNLVRLQRDYHHAHLMGWSTIGPNCANEYSKETLATIKQQEDDREERNRKKQEEYVKKCNAEKAAFEARTAGVEIELSNADLWRKQVEKNSDPYGACAIKYAEGWAKLMQIEMASGKTLRQCAEKTSHELGWLGITGFMYGCAVSVLSACWKHGEELRKWHNKEYGHEGDGVVNPAVLTIETKD